MASNEVSDAGFAAVRRAYERSRWRLATLGFLPALIVPVIVLCVDGVTWRTLTLGLGLFAAGVLLLWRGQDAAGGVLPGVLAGIIPLVAALCAPSMHVCTGAGCMSVCVAACSGGGLVAGVIVGLAWHRSKRSVAALVAAGALSAITGALGCACVGYAGVAGMAAGVGLGALPWIARAVRT